MNINIGILIYKENYVNHFKSEPVFKIYSITINSYKQDSKKQRVSSLIF